MTREGWVGRYLVVAVVHIEREAEDN